MTIKFGMTFAGAVPDFGSIEKCDDRRYTLLTADFDKLNSTLTRATCQPLLKSGSAFNVYSGTLAIVLYEDNKPAAFYMYHSGADRWYLVDE